MTGVGSSPVLATCETSHVMLADLSGGFPGVLPFCPTFRLARLDMSAIILKGTLTENKTAHISPRFSPNVLNGLKLHVVDWILLELLQYYYDSRLCLYGAATNHTDASTG